MQKFHKANASFARAVVFVLAAAFAVLQVVAQDIPVVPCDSEKETEINGKCLPRAGVVPDTAEVCELLGGWAQKANGDGWVREYDDPEKDAPVVCSEVDAVDTFCFLRSPFDFPCRGLFNHVRDCNLTHKRPAFDPFFCGPKCAGNTAALGNDCQPMHRVDLADLKEHCSKRPPENGVSRITADGYGSQIVGEWCQLSARPFRGCYALSPAFANLKKNQLEDDNSDLLSQANPPMELCDDELRFCPPWLTDMDGNHFTESDCGGRHRVDLEYLKANCPTRPPENNLAWIVDGRYNLEEAGEICEISSQPYRACYALDIKVAGRPKSELENDNGDLLSESAEQLDLCDVVLEFCPDGMIDMDGDYFTEGDCAPAGTPARGVVRNY